MQVAERRKFMDIFYINCFSHSLYLSRASNITCFSCFLTIIYDLYKYAREVNLAIQSSASSADDIRESGKRQNKNAGRYKAKESGAECRGIPILTVQECQPRPLN